MQGTNKEKKKKKKVEQCLTCFKFLFDCFVFVSQQYVILSFDFDFDCVCVFFFGAHCGLFVLLFIIDLLFFIFIDRLHWLTHEHKPEPLGWVPSPGVWLIMLQTKNIHDSNENGLHSFW